MKIQARFWLPALLLAVAPVVLAACGGSGEDPGGGARGTDAGSDAGSESASVTADGARTARETTSSVKASTGSKNVEPVNKDHGSEDAEDMISDSGGYSDRAFVDAMVPNHEGAIEMSRVALRESEHEELRAFSKDVIATQQAEVELMGRLREDLGGDEAPAESSEPHTHAMGATDMLEQAQAEPFDKAYIEVMIFNRRSGVAMAKAAYGETENEEIRSLAAGIVDDQTNEIEQLTGWLIAWREDWAPGS